MVDNSPNEGFDLDADLFGEEAAPQGAPVATPEANQSEKPVWKAAGREWNDPAELAKAHDSLTREFSKTKNELKGLSGWRQFEQYLEKNPDLRETLSKAVDDYRTRRDAGQSKTQAERGSGIPSEIASRLDDMQAKQDDIMLDREIATVQRKFTLDDKAVGEVLQFSADNGGMPLEHAYKLWAFDKKQLEAKASGGKAALEAHIKKQKANVGPSSSQSVAPSSANPSKMTKIQHEAGLAKRLEDYGFKD
jgi:hypothetical protein